ncbi:3330_t:CDS:2 [Acaulospora colombiana]|uniref:3330_t:CDS:1 n=1 Tax=Acaulospora colombiana TaxID=27376 RepID=A0ACA9NK87_9GLOM|nr:3330_t:CDS:2 [Acaulospora colombiana]
MNLRKSCWNGSLGDGGLPALLNAFSKWLNRCLNQPGWIATNEGQAEGSRLYDWSAEILKRDPKYKEDARNVLEEAYALRNGLASDSTTNSVVGAIQTLINDLATMGQVGIQVATVESAKQWEAAKAELWKDILSWVLPRVLQAIQIIPLPRVELKSDKLDMVIDKVTLASPSFIPDHIQITNHMDFVLHASSAVRNEDRFYRSSTTTRTRVVVDGLRISVEDIAYYLNAKGPFWSGWLDNGLLTIDVGGKQVVGDGISLVLDVEVPSLEDRGSGDYLFKVLDAKVDVPGLAFQMKQTRHWIFNTLITQPLLGPLVRTAVSLILSAQIKAALESLDSSLCDLRAKASRVTGKRTNELEFVDYWEAFTQHQEPAPSPTVSARSQSPTTVEQEPHTHVETETTTKGIIRTTVVEDAEGAPQSETVLAIGIGEQILPGLGGPTQEPPPTLVEQTRKALDELDEARQEARATAKTATEDLRRATEDVRQRMTSAGERIPNKKAKLAKLPDWRSSDFDI